MRIVCHSVPFVVALVATGCYASFERSGECPLPPGLVCCDARTTPVAPIGPCPRRCPPGASLVAEAACRPASGPDAGPLPVPDGGPVDARIAPPPDAGTCPLARGDFTCLASFAATPDRAFELPVSFATCGCCVTTECGVVVDRARRRVALRTSMCEDDCACDVCTVPTARCLVPALSAGDWEVHVNEGFAFMLPVSDGPRLMPGCAHYARVDACGRSGVEATAWTPDEVCVQRAPYGDEESSPTSIELRSECWPCHHLEGACYAELDPARSDTLIVRAGRFPDACPGGRPCPAVCEERSMFCEAPPLERGRTYRVVLAGGAQVAQFTAGSAERTCSAIDP